MIKETWSEKTIRKALEKKGYTVHEVITPTSGERGANNNVFRARIEKDDLGIKEIYLGYKSVKSVLFNVKHYADRNYNKSR